MATRPTRTRVVTYKPVDVVNVYLWGKHVGAVAFDPTWGYYVFEYTPAFTSLGLEPAPLQMPVRQGGTFMFTDLPEITFKRLPAMLADTLPDDFGNALIDRYMADKGLDKSKVTALDRLAYMGNRAMGALEYKPTRSPPRHKPSAIVLSELVAQARQAVEGTAGGRHPCQRGVAQHSGCWHLGRRCACQGGDRLECGHTGDSCWSARRSRWL
jgi:serine/threonine-protein kinase HipA